LRQLKLKSRLLRWQWLRQLELNFQAAEAPAASTAVASRTAGSPVLDVIGPVPGEAAVGQDHVDDSEQRLQAASAAAGAAASATVSDEVYSRLSALQ
jgi:hypothetical protein